jgi:hypothetical protein
LPQAPRKSKQADGDPHRRGEAGGVGLQGEVVKTTRTDCPEQQGDPENKTQVADPVDDKGLVAGQDVVAIFAVKADQQVGAEPDPFPADKHHHRTIAEDEDQHGPEKEVEVGEELAEIVVTGHIADGVDVDQ